MNRPAPKIFSQLYDEFSQRYAYGVAVQQYAAAVARVRQEAAHSYGEIIKAADRGEDVTAAVLIKLLPHADTAANRTAGAWIHLMPSVSGDIVRRHERLGWAQPSEWPQKAASILQFIRTAVEQPDEFVAACTKFHALPHTIGFQSGTLSPILNALRPNLYLTINAKTLQVINYFSGNAYSQDLLDFPDANAAGQELVQIIRDSGGSDLENSDGLALQAVDRFDLFCQWLATANRINFAQPRIWQIRAEEEGQWHAWQTGGFIALGYDELGDLSDLSRADFNDLRDGLLEKNAAWTKRSLDLVWRFAHQMQEGDQVVVHNGAGEVLGLGKVSGFYYYVPDVFMGHCRPVIWEDLARRQVTAPPGGRRIFSQIGRFVYEAIVQTPPIVDRRVSELQQPQSEGDLRAWERSGTTQPTASVREPGSVYASQGHRVALPAYSLAQCATDTGFQESRLAEWRAAIERKGQAIFYGPPGTGKSFVAAHLAHQLAGGDDGFVETVQFHPAYAYEDFVQGIRPVVDADGGLTYRLVPGLFTIFCQEAARRSGRCVLVIDEINRADLARVFGEVMQLLEYREQSLALATGGHLRIPANVRVLGTMNTADRSIALVDAALRRRFAFLALYPDYDVLRRYHVTRKTEFPIERLIAVLHRINGQIGEADYALGITPFLQPDLSTTISAIWQTEIEPYLEEYFFNRPSDVEVWRWRNLRDELLGELE